MMEVPPPLPPRRTLKHSNTNPDLDAVKHKRSAWHIIDNVFGRSKKAGNGSGGGSGGTLSRMRGQRSDELHISRSTTTTQIDIMCNKQNSYSTPDLTNIVETASSSYNVIDTDSHDLEIMDIERSNSLNSAANQFLCRQPSLNVSSTILWSHNLSSNLSTIADFSTVNLVGANVNAEHFLTDNDDDTETISTQLEPCAIAAVHLEQSNMNETCDVTALNQTARRVIEDVSGYCQMAPILMSGSKSKDSLRDSTPFTMGKQSNGQLTDDIITVSKRISYHDNGDGSSLLDYSLISNERNDSNRASTHEENSSSGISCDEGIASAQSSHTSTFDSIPAALRLDIEPDDGISITCTESPSSPMAISPLEFILSPLAPSTPPTPPSVQMRKNKFDEKYPSYFPNSNHMYSGPIDIVKPAKNQHLNTNSCPNARKLSTNKMFIKNTPSKKQLCSTIKGVNSSNSGGGSSNHNNNSTKKATKQREHSIGNDENSPILTRTQKFKLKKQNLMRSHSSVSSTSATLHHTAIDAQIGQHKLKAKTKSNIEMKRIGRSISPLCDGRIEPVPRASTLPHNTTAKAMKQCDVGGLRKAPSSPRYLYRKCASFAQRMTSSSPTPSIDIVDSGNEDSSAMEKSSTESMIGQTTKANGNNQGNNSGGFRRFATLTRLRKLDFSPLKVKFNNILQRQNSDG